MAVSPINVQVLLTAKDMASASLKSIGSRAKSAGKTMSKSLGSAFAAIKKAAIAGVAAITAISTAALKLALDASKFLDTKEAFNEMTRGMGTNADKVIRTVKDMTRGTISQMDIMQAATKGLSLIGAEQFKNFGKEFGMLAVAAQKASKVMGIDVGFALDSLVTGVGRASKMIIDNLGITFSLEQAYKKTAETLNKTTKELTDNERKAAILNATLEALRTQQGNISISTDSLSVKWAQFKASLSDAKIEIGTRLIPVVIRLWEKLELLWKRLKKTGILNDFRDAVKGAWEKLKDFVNTFVEGFKEVDWRQWRAALRDLKGEIGGLEKAWENLSPDLKQTIRHLGTLTAKGLILGIRALAKAIDLLAEALWALKEVGDVMAELGKIFRGQKIPISPVPMGGKGGGAGFQHGGVAVRPQLATVGEGGPEAIIPLDKMGRVGRGDTFNVYIGMYAGTETEKRRIAEELNEALKRTAEARKYHKAEL